MTRAAIRGMKLVRRAALVALILVPTTLMSSSAAAEDAPALTVRYRSSAWTFSHEQLMTMASESVPNMRGTGGKPAIPFERLMLEHTGLELADIEMIIALRGSGQPVILRGGYLDLLDKLVLTSGEDKPTGEAHEWALAAEDEATYDKVVKAFGSRRKHGVYRIDITPKYGSE